MADEIAKIFIEDCEKTIEKQIISRRGQLIFFKKHKITAFILGNMIGKLKKEITLLKSQKVTCRYAAVSLKICSERNNQTPRGKEVNYC